MGALGHSHPTGALKLQQQPPFADLGDKPSAPALPPLPQGGNRPNYQSIKPQQPGYDLSQGEEQMMHKKQDYRGDFDYEGLNNSKLKDKVFADGNYELPAELKKGALKAADEVMEAAAKDGTKLNDMFPGIEKIANGKIDRNVVASYMVAQSMDTEKPSGLFSNNSHVVESQFTDHFDTSRPLAEPGLAVAQKIYGDNKFDPAVNTHTTAADQAFKEKMKATLPTPKC